MCRFLNKLTSVCPFYYPFCKQHRSSSSSFSNFGISHKQKLILYPKSYIPSCIKRMLMHTLLILNVLGYFYLKRYILRCQTCQFSQLQLSQLFSADTANDSYEFLQLLVYITLTLPGLPWILNSAFKYRKQYIFANFSRKSSLL